MGVFLLQMDSNGFGVSYVLCLSHTLVSRLRVKPALR